MKVKEFVVRETGARLQVEIADTFITRFMGLMGRKKLESGHGLFLSPCNSIHMCFMRFQIDAIYVDKEFRVKKIVSDLQTWTGLSMCLGAHGVIEVAAGDAKKFDIQVGQKFDVNFD